MKRAIILIITLILAAAFSAGCGGVYTPPIITDQGDGGGQDGGDGGSSGGEEEGYTFTVTLTEQGGATYNPVGITARWTDDGGHIAEAAFNANGIAAKSGMDGDYRVTISNLPDGFTYNPNGNYADNDNRDVTIELLPIVSPAGGHTGSDPYTDCIVMNTTGTYRAIVSSAEEGLYYSYRPTVPGKYYIESWVDAAVNEINPRIRRFSGSFANINENDYEDCDTGGASSSFTRNFRYVVECPQGYVGNVWTFKLFADCVSEELYPATVDFSITYEGDASSAEGETYVITSNGPYYPYDDENGENFARFAERGINLDDIAYRRNADGTLTDRIKLNPEDGFYYIIDPDTGEYLKKIYVKLESATYYFENVGEPPYDAFLHNYYFHPEWEEDQDPRLDSFDLRLGVGDYNYDEFHYNDYHHFMETYTGRYREPDPEREGKEIIVLHEDLRKCNKDGAHPVNEELKTFLQEYAKHYLIFRDGDGGGEELGISSSEKCMWLFACGTYE